jgi:peptide-methionine (S)-S-oxide reductase
MAQATFAAGCFWGVEALFSALDGVTSTRVGYIGGDTDNPTYESICTDRTGHAEAVEVEYNPRVISYEQLLNAFFENHDPTTLNRQGPDIGTQYRSAIFYHDAAQMAAALDAKEVIELSRKYKTPVTTQVVPATKFYPAEEYHQHYLKKQGIAHCQIRKEEK